MLQESEALLDFLERHAADMKLHHRQLHLNAIGKDEGRMPPEMKRRFERQRDALHHTLHAPRP